MITNAIMTRPGSWIFGLELAGESRVSPFSFVSADMIPPQVFLFLLYIHVQYGEPRATIGLSDGRI